MPVGVRRQAWIAAAAEAADMLVAGPPRNTQADLGSAAREPFRRLIRSDASMNSLLNRGRFRLDHRWAPPHMSEYLDEELNSRPQQRMERHVSECEECRRLLAGLREMIRVLHGLPTPSGADAGRIAASVRLQIQEPGAST